MPTLLYFACGGTARVPWLAKRRCRLLDVPDIRQRARDNPLETQQLCYVGATRPTTSLILAGV
jgi:hypothetical protein